LVTEIRLYFEGAPELSPAFKEFFGEIKTRAENKGVRFRAVSTGGKPESDFRKGRKRNPDALNILLLDSEGPIDPARHDESVYWMVQVMEAWFLADPDALARYYGEGFNRGALRKNPNVEEIPKKDVESSLKRAIKDCGKQRYHKTKHAPALLESIDPKRVRTAAPNCERLFREVLGKLDEIAR
jgi:hypothetical protein